VVSLTRTFDQVVESSGLDMTADDEHDPDGSTIAFERQQVVALLESARAQLAAVDEAVARVDRGTYGTCEACGRPVGDERLEALPTARTCIACASGR
jgi:DnaK suppressor protein